MKRGGMAVPIELEFLFQMKVYFWSRHLNHTENRLENGKIMKAVHFIFPKKIIKTGMWFVLEKHTIAYNQVWIQ